MADDFIVVCIDVTELSRETGFSCVDFAVDNNSDADSPADVDENNIFLLLLHTLAYILRKSWHGCRCQWLLYDPAFPTGHPPTGRSSKLNWLKLYPDSGFTRPDTFTLIFKILLLID